MRANWTNSEEMTMHYDPVCKRRMNPNKAYVKIHYEGEIYYLCCPLCQAEFEKDPKKYVERGTKKRVRRR